MRKHWKEEAPKTVVVIVLALLITYGPVFIFQLVKAMYGDHKELVEQKKAAILVANPDIPDIRMESEGVFWGDVTDERGTHLQIRATGIISSRQSTGLVNWVMGLRFGATSILATIDPPYDEDEHTTFVGHAKALTFPLRMYWLDITVRPLDPNGGVQVGLRVRFAR